MRTLEREMDMEDKVEAKVIERAKSALQSPGEIVSLMIDGRQDDLVITMITQVDDFAEIRCLADKYYIRLDKIIGVKTVKRQ
ncbi:MAG TPA: hypothetical protein QF469_06515 [Sphingomonas sanguinis]|uniref:hypothetical protein n=1 Tax=Sphingomonas sanguinis TaxID=33051 RepID=UPI002AC296D2|nr:hypothetical protein [Sphingomonas sanguinis]